MQSGIQHFDLVVLGGGVIGLACLRAIKQRHPELSAAVLDAPTAAMPASQAAAGMLAPYAEFAEDSPLARACVRSLGMYPNFVEALTADQPRRVTLSRAGTLIPDVEEDHERFEDRLAQYRGRRVHHLVLRGEQLRAVEPALAQNIERAVWLPEGIVNSRELHDALKQWASDQGVHWIEARATHVVRTDNRIRKLMLSDGGQVECKVLLAATGAWSNEVAALLDLHFDVVPIKGQMTRLAAPDGFLKHVIHLKSLYLAPRPGFGIIIGSTMEEKGFDVTLQQDVLQAFIERADELMPGIRRFPVAESWAGLRPKSTDGLPIIGWSGKWTNLLVATGHFRNGILLTPLTAELVANCYDKQNGHEFKEFSPTRFAQSQ